jgi:hypothetical protein
VASAIALYAVAPDQIDVKAVADGFVAAVNNNVQQFLFYPEQIVAAAEKDPRLPAEVLRRAADGLRSADEKAFSDALDLLQWLEPILPAADPAALLTAALGDLPADDRRRQVVAALGAMGPAAREAVPALRRLLEEGQPEIQGSLEQALLAIEPPPAAG